MGCFYAKYQIAISQESLNMEDLRVKINQDEETINSATKDSLANTDLNYTDSPKKKLKYVSSDNFPRDFKEQTQEEEQINSRKGNRYLTVSHLESKILKTDGKENYSSSNVFRNSKKRKSKIDSFYSEKLLTQVNNIRRHPSEYSSKIEKMITYIIPNNKTHTKDSSNASLENNKFVLAYPNTEKIGLPSGENAFRAVINYLNKIPDGLLPKLTWNEEIKISINLFCEDFSNSFIQALILEKKTQVKKKYPNFTVSLDAISDPELSALLQLVDDTGFQGQRREALLNPNFSYFAVSYMKDKFSRFFALICYA